MLGIISAWLAVRVSESPQRQYRSGGARKLTYCIYKSPLQGCEKIFRLRIALGICTCRRIATGSGEKFCS